MCVRVYACVRACVCVCVRARVCVCVCGLIDTTSTHLSTAPVHMFAARIDKIPVLELRLHVVWPTFLSLIAIPPPYHRYERASGSNEDARGLLQTVREEMANGDGNAKA